MRSHEHDPRRVAVVGGNRIPFARSNGTYAHASNQDMLTATLDGLVERFCAARASASARSSPARCSSTRATATSRASRVLGSRLAPETPAYDVQQACGTGLETVDPRRQQDRARPDRRGHRGRRRHRLRRADRRSTRTCATSCSTSTGAKSLPARALQALTRLRPGQIVPEIAAQRGAAHRPVDGRARGADGARLGRHARGAGRARRAQPPAPRRGLRARLLRRPRHALPRPRARPEPARRTRRVEKLAKLKPVFGGDGRDDDRGQLDAADRRRVGRAAGERGVGRASAACRCSRTSSTRRPRPSTTSTSGEGLLMAPAYAMPRMLDRNGLGARRTSTSTRSTRRSPRRCWRR